MLDRVLKGKLRVLVLYQRALRLTGDTLTRETTCRYSDFKLTPTRLVLVGA